MTEQVWDVCRLIDRERWGKGGEHWEKERLKWKVRQEKQAEEQGRFRNWPSFVSTLNGSIKLLGGSYTSKYSHSNSMITDNREENKITLKTLIPYFCVYFLSLYHEYNVANVQNSLTFLRESLKDHICYENRQGSLESFCTLHYHLLLWFQLLESGSQMDCEYKTLHYLLLSSGFAPFQYHYPGN